MRTRHSSEKDKVDKIITVGITSDQEKEQYCEDINIFSDIGNTFTKNAYIPIHAKIPTRIFQKTPLINKI